MDFLLVENPFLCLSMFWHSFDGISPCNNSIMLDGIFLNDKSIIDDGIPATNMLKGWNVETVLRK